MKKKITELNESKKQYRDPDTQESQEILRNTSKEIIDLHTQYKIWAKNNNINLDKNA
jgi:hypothetical protein